jgi:hypothetical protein
VGDDVKTVLVRLLLTGKSSNAALREEFERLAEEYGGVQALGNEIALWALEMRPKKKGAGAPKQLTTDKIMHIWIAIETEMYVQKKKAAGAIKAKFDKLKMHRKDWNVYVGGDDSEKFMLPKSGRRYHTEGQALMRKDPKLAQRWAERLESQKQIIDEGWSVEIIDGHILQITKKKPRKTR